MHCVCKWHRLYTAFTVTSFEICGECYEQSREEEMLFAMNFTHNEIICGQIFLGFNVTVSVFSRKHLESRDVSK